MAQTTPLIISFNGGEVSPKIDARSDIQKYYSSCNTLENFIPLVEGGATRSPGTYFLIATKDSSKASRVFPFQFSTIQAYVLEFGDRYIRFYKDNGQIVVAYAAWASPVAYAIGDLVTNGGNYYRCLVAHTSGVFAVDLAAGSWAVTGGASDLAYEIPSPYLEADLESLNCEPQSADELYIFHPSYVPKVLSRTAHTSWGLSDLVCKTGDEMAITGITQANPAVVTCTTVPTTLATGDIVYIKSVAGMTQVNQLYFTVGTVVTGAGGTFQLSGVNSTGYGAYTSGGTAQESIYGTTDNNPSCGTFYEQRLVTGGTNNNPQTLNFSVSGDYDNNTPNAASDDAAISYTLVSETADRIFWMRGFDILAVGTAGGVWKGGASTSAEPIAQDNVTFKKQVTVGCKDMPPEVVSDILLWVSRSGQTINQFTYEYEKDKWVPYDMTRIAKHITIGSTKALSGIVDMDYQREPLPILWAVRKDGQLIGMTYETQEDIYAYFRIATDGLFESVAVISQENEEDQVWVVVKRTINGSVARYIEYFKPINFYSVLEDCFYVHSGLTYDGGTDKTVTAISNANPCIVTLAAGHGITAGKKLRFSGTGTWLDTHIVTAHSVNVNEITIYNEADSTAINSTAFPIYTYPPVATTTTYSGTPVNILFAEQSNPCRVVALSHGIKSGIPVRISGVGGMTALNTDYTTTSVSNDTFTISLDATAESAYTSGGTVTEGETTTLSAATCEVVQKTFTGLSHLEAKEVSMLADGAVLSNKTVASGSITMDSYGNKVHIGLPVTSTLEPMKIHDGSRLGTSRGKKQKIHKVTALFYETVGGKTGPDVDTLNIIPFGTGDQPTLTTEDIDIDFAGSWENKATIVFVQDQPLPMTILGLVPHISVNE